MSNARAHSTSHPWPGIEYRHLAALTTVSRAGSFRAAARELGYSQSAVSSLVTQLEQTVGTRMFARRTGCSDIRLTTAGALMLRHATGILEAFAAARADLDAQHEPARGPRVGVLASLAPRLVAPLVRHVAPGGLVTEQADDAALASLVGRGELELAVGAPPPPGPFVTHHVAYDDYVLVTPRTWLATRGRSGGAEPLVALAPWIETGDEHVRRELRHREIEPRTVATAASLATTVALVRGGVGAAILPRHAVAAWDARVGVIELEGLVRARPVCAYAHRDRRLGLMVPRTIAGLREAWAASMPTRRHADAA